MPKIPKVFVSHTSEDKQRFVMRFAERLRSNGIEAWLDIWEMLPGDSLVDKIWNEGLKGCDAMIVVLSNNSINSKWVQEELNSGMVKRIQEKTKLIPVRLDGCEVPECLKATVWENVADLESYDGQFERIVNSIFGQYNRPPVGNAPLFVGHHGGTYSGIAPVDTRVFGAACELLISNDVDLLDTETLAAKVVESGISRNQLSESLEILAHHHYIKPIDTQIGIVAFSATQYGMDEFLRREYPKYLDTQKHIMVLLANGTADETDAISKAIAAPPRVVAHVLDGLKARGLVKLAEFGAASGRKVYDVSPALRRLATE